MGYENSGRRPRPTKLTVLLGNPSKKKLNENEPCPPAGDVVMPPTLSVIARVVWERLAPVCIQMGTLTPADTETFKRLCELQADLDKACESKDAPEFAMFTLSEDYNGAPKMGLHAAIKLEKELSPVIRPFYELFGLSAVSRARIQVPKQPEEPASKWAGALK
jgi:phage terminase small subunit